MRRGDVGCGVEEHRHGMMRPRDGDPMAINNSAVVSEGHAEVILGVIRRIKM